MISNATRAFFALLSTIGAAGLVAFANPANAIADSHHAVVAPVVAAASAGIGARG